MEDSTTIQSNEISKSQDFFVNITARNAFKLVSDAIRKMVHGKCGKEIKNPAGKQVVYEDGSSYFLGVDADGTFKLTYSDENSSKVSELQYNLFRNGSQLVKRVCEGKVGHVRFSLDGSKQHEKLA